MEFFRDISTYSYSELINDPMVLHQMFSDLSENQKFIISQISIPDLINAYRIFGNLKSITMVKAFQSFIKIINANCHSLTAKKNYDDTIDIRIPDYELWSLTKISQLQPFEIGHQIASRLYNAINLPVDIVEDEIEVLARYDEKRTIKIRISPNLVLATLARQGFSFTPIWNTNFYTEIFNKALISNAHMHDQLSSRRKSIEEELDSLSLPATPTDLQTMPSIAEEPMRKRSRSETDITRLDSPLPSTHYINSQMGREMQKFQRRRLKNVSLQFRAPGSTMSSLKMIALLGFQPTPVAITETIQLEAVIEIEDKLESTYQIRFTKAATPAKRTPHQSAV